MQTHNLCTHPHTQQKNVPFTDYFELEPVQSYYKSLPLEDFMEQLAPDHWPPSKRTGYCYRPAGMLKENDCEMKYGNPFGPFWNEFDVEFIDSNFTRLSYDVYFEQIRKLWEIRYEGVIYLFMLVCLL